MELVENRYPDVTKLSGPGRIADNVLQAACVIGTEIKDWQKLDFPNLKGRSTLDDKEIGSGPGSAVMGRADLARLARQQADLARQAPEGRRRHPDRLGPSAGVPAGPGRGEDGVRRAGQHQHHHQGQGGGMASTTVFGSIADYQKGSIEIVSGDPKHYVFSNIFEVASKSKPYERVVVGKNLEYVQEVMRAEGVSPWFACAHDEFALCMDGEVEVDFIKLKEPPDPAKNGAVLIGDAPAGARMGHVKLRRGHQALLPAGCGYRFTAKKLGVILQQTILGELSQQKWSQICLQ